MALHARQIGSLISDSFLHERLPRPRSPTTIFRILQLNLRLSRRFIASARSQDTPGSATLQGTVQDAHGRPVSGASVYLLGESAAPLLIGHTDDKGAYRCSSVRAGTYRVRAEMSEVGDATSSPFVLGEKDTRVVDLQLSLTNASQTRGTLSDAPEFFDKPQFTIAGVTDTTNLGGHASSTARNTGALTRDTVSLRNEPVKGLPDFGSAENALRSAAEHDPANFDTNHRLGQLLLGKNKAEESVPYLERASQINPSDYDISYDLALAYADSGNYEKTRSQARGLLLRQDYAEIHHLLGDVEEKLSNPLQAVWEYQRAAEMNPSEPYLFDWGTELLRHHAIEPAIEVFRRGNQRFPRSTRMLIGLGVASYARGAYPQAAQHLCDASDLNPEDLNPYLFLGKMQDARAIQRNGTIAECVQNKLARFVKFQPENAYANYYYAVNLLGRRKGPNDSQSLPQAESLLEKAVRLDWHLGLGYVHLGILYAEREDLPKAIAAYQKAIEASPTLEEAHYRLAQAYRRTGNAAKADEEIKVYDQLSKNTAAEAERERHEIPQFLYTLRDQNSTSLPQ
jgi:tetratricopeptide (TPR) repeat protein